MSWKECKIHFIRYDMNEWSKCPICAFQKEVPAYLRGVRELFLEIFGTRKENIEYAKRKRKQ